MSFARLGRLTVLLLYLNLAQPFAALAQTNALMPLPAAAQEAVSKGIIAAKLPDYPLAIRYFEEARKIAPDAPVIFLNLGLAESKIPGRELRAIAWFGAYLAAYPDAPNTAAVKEKIGEMDVKNESGVSKVIKSVQDAANIFPVSFLKCSALIRLAEAQIEAGDLAGAKNNLKSALKSADRIDTEPSPGISSSEQLKCKIQGWIASVQAEAGDIAGARETANLIKSDHKAVYSKGFAQDGIAEAQGKAGDIAGAQKTIDSMEVGYWKELAQAAIVKAKINMRAAVDSTTNASLPRPSVNQWIAKNDELLNDAVFLDLAAHLKSLPSDKPQEIFDGLRDTYRKIAGARQVITQMLKQQAQPPTKP